MRKSLGFSLLKLNFVCLLIALACLPIDQRVSQSFSWEKTYYIYWTARHTTDIGLLQHYLIASLFIYLYLTYVWPRWQFPRMEIPKLDFYKKWSLNFFVALLVSGLWVQIIKFLVGRQRPHITGKLNYPFTFKPFNLDVHYNSFPSGHSQVMFAVAVMMTLAFPKQKWLWYLIAAYVCFTRVIVHDHFVSDTVFGACVGYSGAMLSLYVMSKTKNGISKPTNL